jgi:hypothetical protein
VDEYENLHTYRDDFEDCDRTPQKVTIKTIMPYTYVDISKEKRA